MAGRRGTRYILCGACWLSAARDKRFAWPGTRALVLSGVLSRRHDPPADPVSHTNDLDLSASGSDPRAQPTAAPLSQGLSTPAWESPLNPLFCPPTPTHPELRLSARDLQRFSYLVAG